MKGSKGGQIEKVKPNAAVVLKPIFFKAYSTTHHIQISCLLKPPFHLMKVLSASFYQSCVQGTGLYI
jgi:hypothetical protein